MVLVIAVDVIADEVVDGLMNMEKGSVAIEEFMEDLPIQDDSKEEFLLNQELSDEDEE